MGIFNHVNDNPNNKVISSSNKSTFFIYAYYKKSKHALALFLNDITTLNNLIPFDCNLKEISFHFVNTGNNENYLITLNIEIYGRRRGAVFLIIITQR